MGFLLFCRSRGAGVGWGLQQTPQEGWETEVQLRLHLYEQVDSCIKLLVSTDLLTQSICVAGK